MKTEVGGPPEWLFILLKGFCKPWYAEAIEGDIRELYQRDLPSGNQRATWNAITNVLRFFRWRFIKDLEDFQPKSAIGMYKNYFKVSIRSIKKNFSQSLINILGLSIGIMSCLLILMHVKNQLKYDTHIPDFERVYRIRLNETGPYTPARLVKQMQEEIPGIEVGTRTSPLFESIVELADGYVSQDGGIIGDSTFFDVFPTVFIQGNPKEALSGPYNVVLTQSVAQKLFPSQNPVGSTIKSDGSTYLISAVVQDPPRTTTIPYKFIVAIPREEWATKGWWTGNNFYSYVKLNEQVSPEAINARLPALVEKYVGPEMLSFYPNYKSFDEYLKDGHSHNFTLVPLKEVHLHHPRLTLGKPGSFQNLIVFSLLAVFILVVASINYVNMATARATLRSKEIGLRKVMGAIKAFIVKQFLFESFLLTFFSFAIGVLLSVLLLPYFNGISGMDYQISELLVLGNLGWYLTLFLITGFLAGAYPSFYMASLKPVSAIKGSRITGKERLRSYLVVFQFAISLILIAGTYIVYQQVTLMRERKLGLDAEQVLVVENGSKITGHFAAFKEELTAHSGISNVGITNSFPSGFLGDWNYSSPNGGIQIQPYNIFATSEMLEVWGLQLDQGRFFSSDLSTDTSSVVVNNQLVKEMGWQDPIGQTLVRGVGERYTVVGVVSDFVTGSAKRENRACLFRYATPEQMVSTWGGHFIMVKITGDVQTALSQVEETWNAFSAKYPMKAYFMDDSFDRLYQEEVAFGRLFTGFSLLAIFIACSGLYALASFTVDRMRKEIAIRKVMGAKVAEVFTLIGKDFGLLVLLSAVLSTPLIYYFGQHWLNDYVERIPLGFQTLVVPFLLVVTIAFITVSYQTYQAAAKNPAQALKDE